MSERIERVRVHNANPFQIDDRHDGVPYEFPAGKSTVIPLDAAQHIFGFPGDTVDMHAYMAKRFGWNRPELYKADESGVLPWQKMARNVTLSAEHYEVRRVHQPGAPIPAEEAAEAPDALGLNIDPPAPRRGSRVGSRRTGTRRKRQLTPRRVPTASVSPPEPTLGPSLLEPSNE